MITTTRKVIAATFVQQYIKMEELKIKK